MCANSSGAAGVGVGASGQAPPNRAPPRRPPPRTPRGAADDPRARPARRPRRATRVWLRGVPRRQGCPSRVHDEGGEACGDARRPRVVFRLRRGVDGARHPPAHLLPLPWLGFAGGTRGGSNCSDVATLVIGRHPAPLFPGSRVRGAWPGTRARSGRARGARRGGGRARATSGARNRQKGARGCRESRREAREGRARSAGKRGGAGEG